MAKNSTQTIGKNGPLNFPGNFPEKIDQIFYQNLTPKNQKLSRTMHWLKIPKRTQEKFRKNVIAVEVDYLQYTCYDIATPLVAMRNILGFSGTIDDDNSNIEYNYNLNLSLQNRETKMGNAYVVTFLSPGFAPLPIISLEVYNPKRVKTLGTEGKIVFYGAYFQFEDNLKNEAPEVLRFRDAIKFGNIAKKQKNEKPIYKCTRVDIACDIATTVSKKWLYEYIKPNKNSKHVPKPYNYQPELGGFQSIGYIPKLGQCIGLRVYNKILDIQAKNKQSWYPDYGTEKLPNVTRIEVVYSGDSASQNSIDQLKMYTKGRILGDEHAELKRKQNPKSEYSAISAYEYFKRYAKNHGKTLKQVLDDVTCILITEEQKDKFQEIEIFETSTKSNKSNRLIIM